MYPSIKGFRHLYAIKLGTWFQLVNYYIIHHRTKPYGKEINEVPHRSGVTVTNIEKQRALGAENHGKVS